MEKKKTLSAFTADFNVATAVEQVVNLIDVMTEGKSHDFRNDIDESNISREIADLDRKIQNLQSVLASHGEDTKEKLQFYIDNGTDGELRRVLSETESWIAKTKAPQYLHATLRKEAEGSVDTQYFAAVQQWLDIVSETLDPSKDIDFSGEQWHVADHVAEEIQAKHTQHLTSGQCGDLLLWHVAEALQTELSRRGYLVGHPAFSGLAPSPIALSIIHSNQLDKRLK